jgi:hypothetical protein
MEGSMRGFGLLFCLLSLPILATTEMTTQIYDVDYGNKQHDEVLVFLSNGHVAKLRQSNAIVEKGLFENKSNTGSDGWVKIKLDKKRFITNITPIKAPVRPVEFLPDSNNEKGILEYVPTTIANMETAKKYFREARYKPKDSQCFNRAMVWSYEWWQKHSLKSNKLLIYFTRTYIRRYNFEWWFHIAPYVHIMENGKVVERVMDVKYSRGPSPFRQWTNIFMRNDAACPVITKFSDYADYPYSGECFIQRTHMYTYQPADLQMYEAWGYSKDTFNMTEVRGAYLEAYDERI